MTDIYYGHDDATTSSRAAAPVTPSDTARLDTIPKAVYVGGGGNITYRPVDNSEAQGDVVLVAIPAGSVLPIRPSFIRSTGTTATFMVALA